MGGPGSGRKRSRDLVAEPRGTRWRETRQRVLERDCWICGICGHEGAREVDHIVPGRRLSGAAYFAESNLRASHGTSCPCPAGCGSCNQQRRWDDLGTQAAADPRPAPARPQPVPDYDPGEIRLVLVAPGRRVHIRNRDRCETCQSARPLPSACWLGTCGQGPGKAA